MLNLEHTRIEMRFKCYYRKSGLFQTSIFHIREFERKYILLNLRNVNKSLS